MSKQFKIQHGTKEDFCASEFISILGWPLVNTSDWSLFVGDGVTRICDLKPCGIMPENVRHLYERL